MVGPAQLAAVRPVAPQFRSAHPRVAGFTTHATHGQVLDAFGTQVVRGTGRHGIQLHAPLIQPTGAISKGLDTTIDHGPLTGERYLSLAYSVEDLLSFTRRYDAWSFDNHTLPYDGDTGWKQWTDRRSQPWYFQSDEIPAIPISGGSQPRSFLTTTCADTAGRTIDLRAQHGAPTFRFQVGVGYETPSLGSRLYLLGAYQGHEEVLQFRWEWHADLRGRQLGDFFHSHPHFASHITAFDYAMAHEVVRATDVRPHPEQDPTKTLVASATVGSGDMAEPLYEVGMGRYGQHRITFSGLLYRSAGAQHTEAHPLIAIMPELFVDIHEMTELLFLTGEVPELHGGGV
jgi:hypothetical protein